MRNKAAFVCRATGLRPQGVFERCERAYDGEPWLDDNDTYRQNMRKTEPRIAHPTPFTHSAKKNQEKTTNHEHNE